MAQWCLPQIYSEPHEPVCWLDPRDETTKSWIHVLLQEVVHTDGVDYFTTQHELLRAPMPLTGIICFTTELAQEYSFANSVLQVCLGGRSQRWPI